MGKDHDPWHLHNFNYASDIGASALVKQSTSSPVFHLNSALMPLSHPTRVDSGHKRFIVFDHSKNQTNLIYNSVGYPTNSALGLPASSETNVSDGNVIASEEEMHEDTAEIDALLYSNSDNGYEEEEASTGHSPIGTATQNFVDEQDVSSSAVPPPLAKKRRIESKPDPSLADTASSTNHDDEERKKAKREKIQHTVGVLRGIIPGSKGTDAVSVLDEAIRYLRSFRLKAKGVGVASTTSNLK